MSRTIRRLSNLPEWEADRMNRKARKDKKNIRNASMKKRDIQTSLQLEDTKELVYEHF